MTPLPPVEAVGEVPAEQLPALALQLAALQAAVAARLVAPAPAAKATQAPDRLLAVQEVAARTTLSVAWLYRHADALPFARRIGRKVLFSEAGLVKWLATRRP